MTYSEFVRRTITALALFFIAVLAGMAAARLSSVLLITFTCWVLSVGMNALIHRLERRGLSRTVSAVGVLLGVLFTLGLIVLIVVPPFVNQVTNLVSELPDAVESIVQTYEDFRANNDLAGRALPEFTLENYREILNINMENDPKLDNLGSTPYGIEPDIGEIIAEEVLPESTSEPSTGAAEVTVPESTPESTSEPPAGDETAPSDTGETAQASATSPINISELASSALPILGNIGSFVGGFLANLIFVILITSYLLADPLAYYRPFVAIVPASKEQRVVDLINEIRANVITWMGALSISILFTSVTVTLALGVLFQIPNAFALGVLSGLGALIPNLGYYIGLIPIVIFTAAYDPVKVIPAAVVYWLLNQFEASVVTPNVMKNELNIPAGVILPFQLMAAAIMGFVGILLSVPILAILITLVREIYVYDELGKRDHLPVLKEGITGIVYLEYAPETPATVSEAPIIPDEPITPSLPIMPEDEDDY